MAEEPVVVRPRRVWPRRLLIAVNAFVAVCLLLTATAYGYLKLQIGRVGRTDLCRVLRNCGSDDPRTPMNVLLVGSDTRKNISPAEREQFGSTREVGGQRSDTILVLHVDPHAEKAAILSIPRDLAVPIAGRADDRPQRINTAFDKGPQALIATLGQALGIEIDHYAEVDFNGFREVVDAIGGVTVYFASPARDRFTGLDIRRPGCVRLDGDGALQFVRSRHYQYYESGRWRVDGTGDLGRIQRQQDFIRRVMRKASGAGRNPVTLNSLVGTAVKNVTLDQAFSSRDILAMARRFRSLEPDAVEMLSLPTTGARLGAADVLKLKQPEASQLLDRFSGRAPAPAPAPGGGGPAPPAVLPSSVRVRVLNGSGVGGQAGAAAEALQKAGFNVAGTGDGDSFDHRRSVVAYGRGQRRRAELVQAHVGGGAQLKEDVALKGGDIVLVTGASFTGVRAPAPAVREPSGAAPTVAPPPPPAATGATTAARPKGGPAQPAC